MVVNLPRLKNFKWGTCLSYATNIVLITFIITMLTFATFHSFRMNERYQLERSESRQNGKKLDWLIKNIPTSQPVPDFTQER